MQHMFAANPKRAINRIVRRLQQHAATNYQHGQIMTVWSHRIHDTMRNVTRREGALDDSSGRTVSCRKRRGVMQQSDLQVITCQNQTHPRSAQWRNAMCRLTQRPATYLVTAGREFVTTA